MHELQERLLKDYPRLFSGLMNKNSPDQCPLGTAPIKLKPNPKVYQNREYKLQGERAEAIKKLLQENHRAWMDRTLGQ